MPTKHITKDFVDKIKPPKDKKQILFWDTELKGFGILVGKTSKTFVVQKSGGRRLSLGRYGVITPAQARKAALEELVKLSRGNFHIKPKITLHEAHQLHKEGMVRKRCSVRSIEDGNYRLEKYLSDWLSKPLDDITRWEVRERHSKIGKRNGPYVANSVFRTFRAIYNSALREYDLPPNPCVAIHWYKEQRRQEPIENLSDWYRGVMKIQNPIRRTYQLFVLFTGLRRRDAANIRWEDISLKEGTLFRPNPKGGRDKAFEIPLSHFSLGLLGYVKEKNSLLFPSSPWAFPTRGRNGKIKPIQEPKVGPMRDGEKLIRLPSPHRLRDTYISTAVEAGLHEFDIQVLVNHRLPAGGVTAGYVRQRPDHLRKCQEIITENLLQRIKSLAEIS